MLAHVCEIVITVGVWGWECVDMTGCEDVSLWALVCECTLGAHGLTVQGARGSGLQCTHVRSVPTSTPNFPPPPPPVLLRGVTSYPHFISLSFFWPLTSQSKLLGPASLIPSPLEGSGGQEGWEGRSLAGYPASLEGSAVSQVRGRGQEVERGGRLT